MEKATERDRLIEENTGLVHACAKRFAGCGVEYEELYSCGCVGLVKAADRFDRSLGFKFSTYAVPVILGEIKRIFRDGGAVKVSRSVRELALKVSRAAQEFEKQQGRDATLNDLSKILKVSVEDIAEALNASQIPMSLCVYSDEDGESTELAVAVESSEEILTERLTLRQVVSELESPDREIIELRYYGEKTQSEVARELSMTQVQVSRREKKILMKLREKMAG